MTYVSDVRVAGRRRSRTALRRSAGASRRAAAAYTDVGVRLTSGLRARRSVARSNRRGVRDTRGGQKAAGRELPGDRDMRVYCGGTLPSGVRVQRMFDMIVHTGMVDLHGRARGSIDDRSEAVRLEFVAMAPEEANAVIGVQVTTTWSLRHRRRWRDVSDVCRKPGHPRRDMTPGTGGLLPTRVSGAGPAVFVRGRCSQPGP